jgi:SulP family sulfate permease
LFYICNLTVINILKTNLINRYFPFLKTLNTYTWDTFLSDLPAGVLVAILLVPQAIAYAYLAGMPPQHGLYAALIPILIYAVLGTSPHLAIGPVAISALLILAGISQFAEPFTPRYIELTILAGLLIGITQIIMGGLRLGNYINLLSYPVISGFTSAASILIIATQLRHVLGIHIPRFDHLHETIIHTLENILETNPLTLLVAVCTFLIMYSLRRVNKNIPGGLIVVAIGIILSFFCDFSTKGVEIIGFVPHGLPSFCLPSLSMANIIILLPTVFLVTLIGIVESVGIAKALENKNQYYEIDTNKELIALGTSKIGGSLFNAMPSDGSFSRSALLHEAKGRTTIASIITVIFVILSLLFLTPLLYYLPKVILAIIIIYAVKNLFDYQLMKKLFHTHKFDFAILLTTFIFTLFVSIEVGVAIGFLCSLFNLHSKKQSWPKAIGKVLRQNYAQDIVFSDVSDKDAHGELYIKDDLNFGNAYFLKDLIKHKVTNKGLNKLIIHFDKNVDMDSSAVKALGEVLRQLKSKNIKYNVTGINPKLAKKLMDSTITFTDD